MIHLYITIKEMSSLNLVTLHKLLSYGPVLNGENGVQRNTHWRVDISKKYFVHKYKNKLYSNIFWHVNEYSFFLTINAQNIVRKITHGIGDGSKKYVIDIKRQNNGQIWIKAHSTKIYRVMCIFLEQGYVYFSRIRG